MNESRSVSSLQRSLHPAIVPFVEECLRNDKINCQGGILAVTGVKTSDPNGPSDGNCDRFTLAVPFCGTHVKWEMLFDRLHPSLPPDVIISAEDELLGFEPDLENIRSLSEWSILDHSSLSRMVEELLEEYRKHQVKLVAPHQRLQFELNTLCENCGGKYRPDVMCTAVEGPLFELKVDCRVVLTQGGTEPLTRFYIPLDIDFSAIPLYLSKDNPGPDCAALTVVFHPPSATKIEPLLFLSPRVERILGGADTVSLLPWNKDTYMMDYVPNIHMLLQEKVESITHSYVKRKEYVAALLGAIGQAVCEYDSEGFLKIAFLLERQNFCFIALCELTEMFPVEPPHLLLSSVYYKLGSQPLQCSISDCPYNSKWDIDENAKRLKTHIFKILPEFMELCKHKGEFL